MTRYPNSHRAISDGCLHRKVFPLFFFLNNELSFFIGNPMQEGTLHFQSDDVINDYEETITSIGYAIDKYNTSSEYCVWGFGAKFGDEVVRHLFQCGQNQTVKGVDGILEAYKSMFRSGGITMSGPTIFTKAIQAAAVRARNFVSTKFVRFQSPASQALSLENLMVVDIFIPTASLKIFRKSLQRPMAN